MLASMPPPAPRALSTGDGPKVPALGPRHRHADTVGLGRALAPAREARMRPLSSRAAQRCASVGFPGLAGDPFKDVRREYDASATVLKPRAWLGGDRHAGELTDDLFS